MKFCADAFVFTLLQWCQFQNLKTKKKLYNEKNQCMKLVVGGGYKKKHVWCCNNIIVARTDVAWYLSLMVSSEYKMSSCVQTL